MLLPNGYLTRASQAKNGEKCVTGCVTGDGESVSLVGQSVSLGTGLVSHLVAHSYQFVSQMQRIERILAYNYLK